MLFSKSQRVVFAKNPLREVICQLRFPTILGIGSRDPADFQDRIRDAYPLYERAGQTAIPPEVASLLREFKLQGPDSAVSHRFRSEDEKRVISLTRDFVSISDLDYVRWEKFREAVEQAKAALEDIYKPAFYTRTGLRYIDEIDKHDLGLQGEPWSNLVAPQLLGILGIDSVQDRVRRATSQAVITIDAADLPQGNALVTLRHGLASKEDGNGRQTYQIDADFHTDAHLKTDSIGPVLESFNEFAGNLFRSAITEQLHEAMGPEPIT